MIFKPSCPTDSPGDLYKIFTKRFYFPLQTYLIRILRGGFHIHNKIELQLSGGEISETLENHS